MEYVGMSNSEITTLLVELLRRFGSRSSAGDQCACGQPCRHPKWVAPPCTVRSLSLTKVLAFIVLTSP